MGRLSYSSHTTPIRSRILTGVLSPCCVAGNEGLSSRDCYRDAKGTSGGIHSLTWLSVGLYRV